MTRLVYLSNLCHHCPHRRSTENYSPMPPAIIPYNRSRLRPMQTSDLEKVHALEVQCQAAPWPPWVFRRLLRTGASSWVLEHNGEIAAFGMVTQVRNFAHIMNMCVAPEFRRQGLGRRMMLQLLAVARHRHARYAWLEVRRTNNSAIRLYRKLGFHKKLLRRHYYSGRRTREDAIVMVARLSKPTRLS